MMFPRSSPPLCREVTSIVEHLQAGVSLSEESQQEKRYRQLRPSQGLQEH